MNISGLAIIASVFNKYNTESRTLSLIQYININFPDIKTFIVQMHEIFPTEVYSYQNIINLYSATLRDTSNIKKNIPYMYDDDIFVKLHHTITHIIYSNKELAEIDAMLNSSDEDTNKLGLSLAYKMGFSQKEEAKKFGRRTYWWHYENKDR
jgi:hypothetical protein